MDNYILINKQKEKLFNETLQLAKEIYVKNSAGGLLHIVLDDGNLKNCHIESCIEDINNSDEIDKDLYLKCANNILKMTLTQRNKLL